MRRKEFALRVVRNEESDTPPTLSPSAAEVSKNEKKVKIEVIRQTRKQRKEWKRKLDTWIEGTDELENLRWNWSKRLVMDKKEGMVIKRFNGKMDMLSYLMNGGRVVKNEFNKWRRANGKESKTTRSGREGRNGGVYV